MTKKRKILLLKLRKVIKEQIQNEFIKTSVNKAIEIVPIVLMDEDEFVQTSEEIEQFVYSKYKGKFQVGIVQK